MRERKQNEERTSFQEHGAYDPRIDSKADVAMVYGLDRSFEERMEGWRAQGYRLHVMTGVSWGSYADYVRGEWDGTPHFDDAQTASGNFRLEHGITQGHDIYYMMPSMPYVHYLAEKLHRVVDAGAVALHLEEPEFWVRAGYEVGFQKEWQAYYGEDWQDPATSPDARYRCEKLKQYLYTRALSYLFADIKQYAQQQELAGFSCYVPTHSLINYAHWRIVSPEAQLLSVKDCDGIIGQVWTGTSRTPNYYRGVYRQRTFEAGYCEYAACSAMVRGTRLKLWQLADPIEDNPNYCWEDYRRCWECDVTASLLSPENTRFEIMPWPTRIFTRTYPKENLDSKPLDTLLEAYIYRLEKIGKAELAANTRSAISEFQRFHQDHADEVREETLGFANQATQSSELRFGDILGGAFAFYKYLATLPDQVKAQVYRDAVSSFYHDPTDEREYIPAAYATELQVVFNALADMAWPGDYEWLHGQTGVGVVIADTLMYQRGDPSASDADLSSVYGLAMPLIKHGVALTITQLERYNDFDRGYLDGVNILIMTYEGMKPASPEMHRALVEWIENGHVMILIGTGDAFNQVREWWNQDGQSYQSPQEHLTELLGLGKNPGPGVHLCKKGALIYDPHSPAELAHRNDGDQIIIELVKQAHTKMGIDFHESDILALRRGPYVSVGGMDETTDVGVTTLPGKFVNLYDPHLGILENPIVKPDTRRLLVDLSHCPEKAWVVAAAGRVSNELATNASLLFHIAGMAQTVCAARVLLPSEPRLIRVAGENRQGAWDADSKTLLLEFPNSTTPVSVEILFQSQHQAV